VAYLAAHSYDFSVGNLSGQLTKLKKDKSFQCVEWHSLIITIIIKLTRCSQTEDYRPKE